MNIQKMNIRKKIYLIGTPIRLLTLAKENTSSAIEETRQFASLFSSTTFEKLTFHPSFLRPNISVNEYLQSLDPDAYKQSLHPFVGYGNLANKQLYPYTFTFEKALKSLFHHQNRHRINGITHDISAIFTCTASPVVHNGKVDQWKVEKIINAHIIAIHFNQKGTDVFESAHYDPFITKQIKDHINHSNHSIDGLNNFTIQNKYRVYFYKSTFNLEIDDFSKNYQIYLKNCDITNCQDFKEDTEYNMYTAEKEACTAEMKKASRIIGEGLRTSSTSCFFNRLPPEIAQEIAAYLVTDPNQRDEVNAKQIAKEHMSKPAYTPMALT
jgi:hypothetical protein